MKESEAPDAEELLRLKIEETNKKINDYLLQSQKRTTAQSNRMDPSLLDGESLEPRQLDFAQQPSQALNETLARFQNMIKQVEKRFAEKEYEHEGIFEQEELKVEVQRPKTAVKNRKASTEQSLTISP